MKETLSFKNTIIFKLKHSVLIRVLALPFMTLINRISLKKYQNSDSKKSLEKLKDKHKGQRCFIIGNGPSLNPSDLDLLQNEVTFASNRIYYMFDKTKWRPTYFVSTDMDILRQEFKNIESLDLNYKFINYKAKKFAADNIKNSLIYIFLNGKFPIKRNHFVQKSVSEDISKFFSLTQTVTCVCMELAIFMGFEEIYLLGVDHNFSVSVKSDGKVIKNEGVKNYFEGMKGGDSQAVLYVDDTTACYQLYRNYANMKKLKIYNATRGGKLEVFDRISLDDMQFTEVKS